MTALPPADHARTTYDAFAAFYDLFTAHHDYERWTFDLERLAVAAGLRGRRLLDVACGTGKSLLPFVARGYSVVGCDISPQMVREAERKVDGDVRLEVLDMRELPHLGTFDLVCCLDDAFNYLLTSGDLVAALAGLRRNLAGDGVIVFDVNSVRSYRTFYAALTLVPSEDRVVVWDGRTSPRFAESGLAEVSIQLLERRPDGTWRSSCTSHHQRHHPRGAIERAARSAGLR